MPKHDVYRDADSNPVTLTENQVSAVWHAIHVRDLLMAAEDKLGEDDSIFDLSKSRLLGRMLIDGRPPLDEKPPRWMGAPGYHLVEPDVGHYYMGTGPMPAEILDGAIMEIAD